MEPTTPDQFGKLAPSRRAWLRKRRLWEAEWRLRGTPHGGLVAQLRARAKSAATLAVVMLVALILIGGGGLGWLVADALGYLTSETEQAEKRALVSEADRRINELDVEAAELNAEFSALSDSIANAVGKRFAVVARVSDRPLNDLRFGPNGEAVAVGLDGLIVARAPGSSAWVDASLAGEGRALIDLGFGPNGEAVAVGEGGLIVTRGGHALNAITAATTEADLRLAVLAAPDYPEKQDWLVRIGSLQGRRAPLDIRIAAAQQQREAAAQGTLTDDTKLNQMGTFLTNCAGLVAAPKQPPPVADGAQGEDGEPEIAGSHETVAACADAYRVALADQENAFFEYLIQRLTPLALLIFLLATLGGAYRYNARLAGFYHARADALEAAAFTEKDEALERMVMSFAAEKTPFKDPRLPIDAATDFAKEALSKVKVGP